MSKFPSRENLTREQSECLEKAALLILNARKDAAAMLAQAGIDGPGDVFRSKCEAHIPAFGPCACGDYTGDGGPCKTLITVDLGSSPPQANCSHPPSKHVFL